MTDNEFLLEDRKTKIKSTIEKYGEENFYLAFSGGADSTALSYLIDLALPDNKIPRVYCDTGIEYNHVRNFVKNMKEHDDRIVIIKPSTPIKSMLEEVGYPFKSKDFSDKVYVYQHNGYCKYVDTFLHKQGMFGCPKKLFYMFSDENKMKISKKCCDRLKKQPSNKWAKENNKTITITGLMKAEGGVRTTIGCTVFTKEGKLKKFNPLSAVSKEWTKWFVDTYKIELCDLYSAPYNFERTGCKGCPYDINLQQDLDILDKYFPEERQQCEIIWEPVYTEYRRIGYRLREDTSSVHNLF